MSTMTARTQKCAPVGKSGVQNALVWAAFAWAATLVVIFFNFRGDDLGRLPQFLSSFTTPFQGFAIAGMRDSVLGAAVGIFVLLAWFGYGDLLERILSRFVGPAPAGNGSTARIFASKCAWGAGVSSLLMFVVGTSRLYTKTVAAIGLALGLLLFSNACRGFRVLRSGEKLSGTGRLAIVFATMPVLVASIASLAPPIAKDTLLYHIALPKAFLEARGLADVRYNIAQFYALGAELNGAWAMLLGRWVNARVGEAAFGFTQFLYLPLLLLATFGWMRRRNSSRELSLIAVCVVACVPTFFSSASSAYNDCALALYMTLAIAGATTWWKTLDRRTAAEIGIAIGFGLCVKLLTLFLVAPLLLLVLLRIRKAQEEGLGQVPTILRSAVIAASLAVVLAAPWYVRNWVRTGSPVFPFYMNIFHGSAPGWDQQRSVIDQILNARYGGYPKGLLDYAAVPVRLSLAAQPEYPAYFDGVLGISFLTGLPIFLLAAYRKRVDGETAVAAGLGASVFLAWLFTSEQLRYLLPAIPALAVAICVAATSLDRRFRYVLLATALPGFFVASAWFLRQNPAPVVAGAEPRNAYLTRTLDHYSIYETANSTLPADARVWLINMRRDTYYLDRPYFSDFRIEHYTLMKLVADSNSADEMRQRAREMGITHLLFRRDTLLDPATSPIIDERKSQQENARRFANLQEFLLGGKVLRVDGNFVLAELK